MHKVLIVFNHPAPYKVKLFNELSKSLDLTVIFERDSESDRNKAFYDEKRYEFKTVKVRGLKFGREGFISGQVAKHIKNNRYDLIIMNGYSHHAERKAIRYMKNHKIPYVLYINGGIIKPNESKLKKSIKTKYISGALSYLSPDESSNEYLVYYGADKDKIFNYNYSTIFKHEVLPKPFSSKDKILLRKDASITDEKVFVSCGQLIKRKNYFELIRVWKDVNPNYGLYIIGDGKLKPELQKFIYQNNLNNVHLLGYMKRSEMFDFYHLSDAFIFPSNEDIYGHVVNEAMSQGLPVISTPNVNSSRKLIKNGYNGFMVENIESKAFIDAIKETLNLDMGENAIKTAYENTIEIMRDEHLEIIERIIEK